MESFALALVVVGIMKVCPPVHFLTTIVGVFVPFRSLRNTLSTDALKQNTHRYTATAK